MENVDSYDSVSSVDKMQPSARIPPLKAIQDMWVSQLLNNTSTIEQASQTVEKYKAQLKKKLAEIQLPNPNNDMLSASSNAKASYMELAKILSILEALQSQESKDMSKSMGDLAVSQANFGNAAAQSTYNSDIDTANGTFWQGVWSIVGGGVGILASIGGAAMEGLSIGAEDAATETTEIAETGTGAGSSATKTADTVTDVVKPPETIPKSETPEGEGGAAKGSEEAKGEKIEALGEKGGAPEEPLQINQEAERNIQSTQAKQEEVAEENAAKIEKISKDAEKGGSGPAKTEADEGAAATDKSDLLYGMRKSKAWATIAKGLINAPQTVSPVFSGAGGVIGGQYQEAAAVPKRLAGYEQVVQGLARSAYESTQSTVGSTDKLTGDIIKEREELLRQNASVTQYRG
jgi:hypothetical protein